MRRTVCLVVLGVVLLGCKARNASQLQGNPGSAEDTSGPKAVGLVPAPGFKSLYVYSGKTPGAPVPIYCEAPISESLCHEKKKKLRALLGSMTAGDYPIGLTILETDPQIYDEQRKIFPLDKEDEWQKWIAEMSAAIDREETFDRFAIGDGENWFPIICDEWGDACLRAVRTFDTAVTGWLASNDSVAKLQLNRFEIWSKASFGFFAWSLNFREDASEAEMLQMLDERVRWKESIYGQGKVGGFQVGNACGDMACIESYKLLIDILAEKSAEYTPASLHASAIEVRDTSRFGQNYMRLCESDFMEIQSNLTRNQLIDVLNAVSDPRNCRGMKNGEIVNRQ